MGKNNGVGSNNAISSRTSSSSAAVRGGAANTMPGDRVAPVGLAALPALGAGGRRTPATTPNTTTLPMSTKTPKGGTNRRAAAAWG